VIALWATVIVCLAVGVRPWKDGALRSGQLLCAGGVCAGGGGADRHLSRVSARRRRHLAPDRAQPLCGHWLLTRRNTRRYGGYIIHIGVVIVVIGLAGSAFNRNVESEMALHDKMQIGPTRWSKWAHAGLEPELQLRVRAAGCLQGRQEAVPDDAGEARLSGQRQPQTMVAIHSVPEWDLYVVYEGTNPDTGQPIIKAFLNPLVGWIWAGLVVLVFGTLVALVPSLSRQLPHCACRAKAAPMEPALKGGD
jgi:cytochrome c-type biogenesis protein CcmF